MTSEWEIREIGDRGKRMRWFCTHFLCYEPATHYLVLLPGKESIGMGSESRSRRCEHHARQFAEKAHIKFPESAGGNAHVSSTSGSQ